MDKDLGTKRYNLVLPMDLFNQVMAVADAQKTTVVEIIRKFLKLGVIVTEIMDNPNQKLILRDGNTERELWIL